jgi:hypothetical protein
LPIVSPAASVALSLVALVLSIAAIILATIANRRWVGRSRPIAEAPAESGEDASDAPAARSNFRGLAAQADLTALQDQLAALGVHVGDLRSDWEGLAVDLASVRADLTGIGVDLASVRADLAAVAASPAPDPTALRHVALVRYDAFADVGGRLSYSLALLDDTRSGLVLTTLAGKTDVRTYARTISAGAADGTLTAEEQQAIEAAAGPTGSRP